MKDSLSSWSLFLVALTALLPLSCSSEMYLEEADRDVYDIIQEKQEIVLGKAEPFAIDEGERVEDIRDGALDRFDEDPDPWEEESVSEEEAAREEELAIILAEVDEEHPLTLDLVKSLEIGFRINWDYKDEKEDLYISALNLTFQRFLWTPQFEGILGVETGEDVLNQRYVGGNLGIGYDQLFATGGQLTLNLATDLLRIYSPDTGRAANSLVQLDFLQPLWRGFGSLVATENLTQAERNVAYTVRSFDRFRKQLAVTIASSYYNVLEQLNTTQNELNNFKSLERNLERSVLMAQAGRLAEFEVDQSRQDVLSAENRWILAQQRYEQLVDDFKIELGLPMETPLVLDMKDMETLAEAGPDHPELIVELAIEHALTHRLDLLNTMDQVEDTRRRVLIAENGLAPDLDFTFQYDLVSIRENDPLSIDFEPNRWSAGLDLNLPLQRIEERNKYRQSIIDLERQKRSQAFQEDNIKGDVRQSYRRLNQAKDTYEIQKVSLMLAEKRVESTDLLLQAGRAQTRDYLEAQNALLQSQNALAAAIVEHTIARLNFLLDIEALEITQGGLIELIQGGNALIQSLQARGSDEDKGPENDDEPDETEE